MATIRARRAFDKFVEARGAIGVSRAMREAGYSPISAKNPKNLTASKSWQQMMDEHFPDEFIAAKHQAFLNKTEKIVLMNKGKTYIEDTGQPHSDVGKALDMAYKLKRRYGDVNIGQAVVLNISGTAASKYGLRNELGSLSNEALHAPVPHEIERVDAKVANDAKSSLKGK